MNVHVCSKYSINNGLIFPGDVIFPRDSKTWIDTTTIYLSNHTQVLKWHDDVEPMQMSKTQRVNNTNRTNEPTLKYNTDTLTANNTEA